MPTIHKVPFVRIENTLLRLDKIVSVAVEADTPTQVNVVMDENLPDYEWYFDTEQEAQAVVDSVEKAAQEMLIEETW